MNDITELKRMENEFISLVSHELRTPMTSIIGALDLLGSGQLGELSDRGRHILNVATNNTERLIRLVNDILDLERIKSGKITVHKVSCDLKDLLIQAIETMQPMADKVGVKLEVEPCPVMLKLDPDRILQTLTNLLSNAIKFSEPGKTVWLKNRVTEDRCLIAVMDQGRGIPVDKLQSIFEPFQQVDASDSRSKNGSGLGLAISRYIVKQHEGEMWAESIQGQGSTFFIDFPLVTIEH
jgi:signal transduction histidine kinase